MSGALVLASRTARAFSGRTRLRSVGSDTSEPPVDQRTGGYCDESRRRWVRRCQPARAVTMSPMPVCEAAPRQRGQWTNHLTANETWLRLAAERMPPWVVMRRRAQVLCRGPRATHPRSNGQTAWPAKTFARI